MVMNKNEPMHDARRGRNPFSHQAYYESRNIYHKTSVIKPFIQF